MALSDTAPIRSEERFDEDRVAGYLRAALPELVGNAALTFDQFPGGEANLTYRAVAGETELVLRRAPLGAVARGGHDMAREYRVLSRLWRGYPPAPRAYHFCEDPEVMGKPFLVMERRHGHVVRSSWPAVMAGTEQRREVCRSLVDALAALHRVEPEAVGLGQLGRPEGFVSRQVAGWSRRWAAAATRRIDGMEALTESLANQIPVSPAVTLLHNDFKLDNAMVAADGSVVAVLDWDMATRGDPLVDLGTLVAYWADEAGPAAAVFGGRVQALAPYMPVREVVDRYASATGADVDDLSFHVAFAYFRIAVIIEQIYARFVRGQTTNERFAAFAPAAPLLVEAARATLATGLPA